MSDFPGLGVMLRALTDTRSEAAAVQSATGKTIAVATLDAVTSCLRLGFDDGTALVLWDAGQSCCESRYMRTDDDLSSIVGATLVEILIREAPSVPDASGMHEVQFLALVTSKGEVVFSSHNEHNGYYGGFSIAARTEASR